MVFLPLRILGEPFDIGGMPSCPPCNLQTPGIVELVEGKAGTPGNRPGDDNMSGCCGNHRKAGVPEGTSCRLFRMKAERFRG
jgi:hypothetical protein